MLDSGAGALRNVANFGYDYRKIHHLCYSHLHPDHTIDFVPLLFALKNDPDVGEIHRLNVNVPAGFIGYYKELLKVYNGWIQADHLDVEITERGTGEQFSLASATVETGPVIHADESIAYRFTDRDGATLVYSGDTGYAESFAEFARDADLLILESAVPEGTDFAGHCTPSEAGKIAELAGAKRTMLTHFYPQVEREDIAGIAQQYYSGEILLASDGLTVEISKH